jgi:hypothetical protein
VLNERFLHRDNFAAFSVGFWHVSRRHLVARAVWNNQLEISTVLTISITVNNNTTIIIMPGPIETMKDALKSGDGDKDKNPVQVATEDLKMGKEKFESEMREKTEHIGREAEKTWKAATEKQQEKKSED